MKTLLKTTLIFTLLSGSAFANEIPNPYNDPQFNPNEEVKLNQEEAKDIQGKLDADKAKFTQSQVENNRRLSVIQSCSQYMDDIGSPEAIAKTKKCLSDNNGFFPEEYQIKNAVALDQYDRPLQPQQNTNNVIPNNPVNNPTNMPVKQPENKTPTQPADSGNNSNDFYLGGILR